MGRRKRKALIYTGWSGSAFGSPGLAGAPSRPPKISVVGYSKERLWAHPANDNKAPVSLLLFGLVKTIGVLAALMAIFGIGFGLLKNVSIIGEMLPQEFLLRF